MKITKLDDNYIINEFHEIDNFELEAEVLRCFLGLNRKLLFGCKWKVIDLHNIDNEIMSEQTKKMYKELAQFMIHDEENDRRIKAEKLFIDERTVLTNNEWPFAWEAPNKGVTETIWFCPRGKSEIVKSIKIDQLFNCIVLDINSQFNDFSYAIGLNEDDDGTSLEIIVKNEDEFINVVIPKLQKLINNLVIEVNETE